MGMDVEEYCRHHCQITNSLTIQAPDIGTFSRARTSIFPGKDVAFDELVPLTVAQHFSVEGVGDGIRLQALEQ